MSVSRNTLKVLVTGSTSLLGGRLLPYLRSKGVEVVGHGMRKKADVNADLSCVNETWKLLNNLKPNAIIHLVCLSNVDQCEKNPKESRSVNVGCLENVVSWLRENRGTRLIHISTDQVYDGPGFHNEKDISIRNVYARTKYESEQLAIEVDGVVLRTNFFGRSYTEGKKSFSDWLMDCLREQKPFMLFEDVMFNPLSMKTLSGAIFRALASDVIGVFNVGSRGGMSKRDFAYRVASRVGMPVHMAYGVKVNESGLLAARPTGMLMDVTRFEKAFGVILPMLENEIQGAEL